MLCSIIKIQPEQSACGARHPAARARKLEQFQKHACYAQMVHHSICNRKISDEEQNQIDSLVRLSHGLSLPSVVLYLIVAYSIIVCKKQKAPSRLTWCFSYGAEDEIRTRDFHLGKVTLYH